MMHGYYYNGFFGGFHMLVGLGVTLIVIALIVHFIQKNAKAIHSHDFGHQVKEDPVLTALKMRLVRGELTEEEYLIKKELLETGQYTKPQAEQTDVKQED